MIRPPQPALDLNAEISVDHAAREAGRFAPGCRHSPETEIRPGQRLSPQTEFKSGQPAPNRLPVGSVTVRTQRGGVRRAFVKIADPNVWRERAKVVWEEAHGQRVPRGKVIHHKDRDTLNDAPDNLVALTRKEHAIEHADEYRAAGFSSEESRRKAVSLRHPPRRRRPLVEAVA